MMDLTEEGIEPTKTMHDWIFSSDIITWGIIINPIAGSCPRPLAELVNPVEKFIDFGPSEIDTLTLPKTINLQSFRAGSGRKVATRRRAPPPPFISMAQLQQSIDHGLPSGKITKNKKQRMFDINGHFE